MMARLRWVELFLCLLLRSDVQATESIALTAQQPVSVPKFQEQDYAVGLLDRASIVGRAQVVHIDKDYVSLPLGKERKVSHIKAYLLSFGLFASLARNIFFLEATARNDWVGFVVLLALYLVEASNCSTRRYLSNIKTPLEVQEYILRLKEVTPIIRFHLECYHYEDDDGFAFHSSPRRKHENSSSSRRVTHRASELYDFKK